MNESFNIPDSATMREEIYQREKRSLESKITDANSALLATEEEGELVLINATLKELQKKLNILEAQHQSDQ